MLHRQYPTPPKKRSRYEMNHLRPCESRCKGAAGGIRWARAALQNWESTSYFWRCGFFSSETDGAKPSTQNWSSLLLSIYSSALRTSSVRCNICSCPLVLGPLSSQERTSCYPPWNFSCEQSARYGVLPLSRAATVASIMLMLGAYSRASGDPS
jgi:hypothetical protein